MFGNRFLAARNLQTSLHAARDDQVLSKQSVPKLRKYVLLTCFSKILHFQVFSEII